MEKHEKSFVFYWMQASQRVEHNEALAFAIEKANALAKPLIVYFGLAAQYDWASARHYRFMLEGLVEVQKELQKRSIQMIVRNNFV